MKIVDIPPPPLPSTLYFYCIFWACFHKLLLVHRVIDNSTQLVTIFLVLLLCVDLSDGIFLIFRGELSRLLPFLNRSWRKSWPWTAGVTPRSTSPRRGATTKCSNFWRAERTSTSTRFVSRVCFGPESHDTVRASSVISYVAKYSQKLLETSIVTFLVATPSKRLTAAAGKHEQGLSNNNTTALRLTMLSSQHLAVGPPSGTPPTEITSLSNRRRFGPRRADNPPPGLKCFPSACPRKLSALSPRCFEG